MENVKNMKIIAVDTSLGTNFLLSACEDITVAELRGIIQKEHMSCFPEHESINVGALLVDYNQRQYRVANQLLIGQLFRKCWNKIHAVISLGSSKTGLFLNDPKPIEIESFVDGKMGIPDTSLDKRPFVKQSEALLDTERKDLSVDRHSLSDEDPTHACLCQTKALDNYTGTAPAMLLNQDCWIDHEKFGCPLFSSEAPYTQPCSELNVVTRAAAVNKGVLETKKKRKRRRGVEEIPVKKKKQREVNSQIISESVRDRESNPDDKNSSSTNEEPQAKIHEDSVESLQLDTTDGRDGFNGKTVLSKGKEHLTNACEPPNNDIVQQHTRGSANYIERGRGQRENFLATNAEAIVSNPEMTNLPAMILESHHNPLKRANEEAGGCQVQKKVLEPSWNEKGYSNSKRKAEEFISETSDKTGTKGCPEISSRILQEGTEEAALNNEAQIHEMDLSLGYPIKINDHTVLLVASLSADVVPETQESQMESQDGINPGDEGALEQVAVEPIYRCLDHEVCPLVESVEHKEMETLVLPSHQDARNRSTQELDNQVEGLAVLADKEENLKPKPLVIAEQPSEGLSPEETDEVIKARKLFDKHHHLEKQLVNASCSSDSHIIYVRGKKKKSRRRKVSEIDQVLKQEDDRLVSLNIEEQGVEGGVGFRELMGENAQMTECMIETSHSKLGTGNEVHAGGFSEKLDINKDSFDDVNIRSRDPGSSRIKSKEREVLGKNHCKKRQKQMMDSCNEPSPFAGECITEFTKVAVEARIIPEDGGECMEGSSIGAQNISGQEKLCHNEGAEKESDRTHRKKKKRRKKISKPTSDRHDGAGINNIHSSCEGAQVDECANNNREMDFRPSTSKENKESRNAVSLAAIKEDDLKQGAVNLNNNVGGEEVAKKKSKRKTIVSMDSDLEMCLTQEQDQNMTHANVNDTQSVSKDDMDKSSPVSPSKEPSQEDLVTIKRGFDVFEFESSETVNRQKENSTHLEATSNVEADNLDKLCSAAMNFVEDETLSAMKMTRKSSRKTVHPKRWVTVLSERLTWNRTSKSSSKQRHADKKKRLKTRGTSPPVEDMSGDRDLGTEAGDVEEEGKEGSSQVIVDDGRIACPVGCGRLYSKKTSAYYRHCKKCLGGDF